MASAIFIVPVVNNNPSLPVDDIFDGTEVHGWSCIGQVPQGETCLVRVWASEGTLDAMAADDAYLFVEDVDG